MHPALILLPLASLLHVATATANNDTNNTTCTQQSCGNVTIKYPFSLSGVQPLYCSYPVFDLTCDTEAGRAYLNKTFREHLYRVDSISYENSTMVVAVQTTFAGDGSCPVPDFNVSSSLASFAFTIRATNKHLVFFYNCTVPSKFQLPGPCANHTMGAYISDRWDGEGNTLPSEVPKNCISVSVPVGGFHQGMEPAHVHYERLIRDGFLLEWPPMGDCDACKRLGGECRFVQLSFQCVCPDGLLCPNSTQFNSTSPPGSKHRSKLTLIVSLSAAASLLFACLAWLMYRQKQKFRSAICRIYSGHRSNAEEMLRKCGSLTLKRYKYSELKKITRSFKDKLGEGAYGTVYKGSLQDGRMVAVKLLKGSKGHGEDFLNEVTSISRTSHVNIVSLLGFSLEGSKRALVYEYMLNGSLQNHICSESSKLAIGWEMLLKIAIGIARGLEYLHQGCNTRIIHFDIKPHNILLDHEFCPKIADFGLAKLCHLKGSVLSTAEARGTVGFIAPEVFSRGFGVVSTKSDVYSYGMMLLEMIRERKNLKGNADYSSETFYPHWVHDRLVRELQGCEVTRGTEEIVRKMALVGLWCIQMTPESRPSMNRVIEMLERNINELEVPPKPFLCSPLHSTNVSSYTSVQVQMSSL